MKNTNWYIYNEAGNNVAVVNGEDLIEAQREASCLGFRDYSVERS